MSVGGSNRGKSQESSLGEFDRLQLPMGSFLYGHSGAHPFRDGMPFAPPTPGQWELMHLGRAIRQKQIERVGEENDRRMFGRYGSLGFYRIVEMGTYAHDSDRRKTSSASTECIDMESLGDLFLHLRWVDLADVKLPP